MGLNPEMVDLVLLWLVSLPWVLLGYPQITKRGKGHRSGRRENSPFKMSVRTNPHLEWLLR